MMKRFLATFSLVAAATTTPALEYNQNITAIFGSGNPDGGWTTGTGTGGLELGLRAKNRDDGSTPNVDGVYSFPTGYAVGNPARALWNFEFSIDVGAQSFSMFDFYLGIDTDAGEGVNYVSSLIDPLLIPDNAYGGASTANGGGVSSANLEIIPTIAQNSLNIAFLGGDPSSHGIYDYRLFAVAKETQNSPLPSAGGSAVPLNNTLVADVNIQVRVSNPASVPDAGGTLAFLSLGLAGLAGLRRRIAP